MESTDPFSGRATVVGEKGLLQAIGETEKSVQFIGWLGLLRAISELVGEQPNLSEATERLGH